MTTNETAPAIKPTRVRAAKTAVDAASPPPAAETTASKSDTVVKLLLRAKGATPLELIAATDWQPHSLRAFLSGLRKKGRVIVRETRKGGGYVYRIVAATSAQTATVGDAAQPDAAA